MKDQKLQQELELIRSRDYQKQHDYIEEQRFSEIAEDEFIRSEQWELIKYYLERYKELQLLARLNLGGNNIIGFDENCRPIYEFKDEIIFMPWGLIEKYKNPTMRGLYNQLRPRPGQEEIIYGCV